MTRFCVLFSFGTCLQVMYRCSLVERYELIWIDHTVLQRCAQALNSVGRGSMCVLSHICVLGPRAASKAQENMPPAVHMNMKAITDDFKIYTFVLCQLSRICLTFLVSGFRYER